MKHKIGIIVSYVGKLPDYFPFFIASCKKNPSIDFYILNDTVPGNHVDQNIRYLRMSLPEFNKLASEKLNIPVHLKEGWKMNELKPALGVLFDDLFAPYDFWGWSDLDIIFGNMRDFLSEDVLDNYDVITTRANWTTGHFTLFRNKEPFNALFKFSPSYQQIFTSDVYTAFEESCHRWQGEFFAIDDLVSQGRLVSMYDVVRNLEKKGVLKAHFKDIIREHPQPIDYLYSNGKLIDRTDDREFFYHHLITIKKIWRFYIPQWKIIPSTYLISRWGIMSIRESKGFLLSLWFVKRALYSLPRIFKSIRHQEPKTLLNKLYQEVRG